MVPVWVIFVAGHAVTTSSGQEFFHDHAACVAKAAELGGACEVMTPEPPAVSQAHKDWEKVYCIPGVDYMAPGNGIGGCPGYTAPDPNK